MATVDITLAVVQTQGRHGGTVPVFDSAQVDTDTITSSASSQQSDFAVPTGATGLIWDIVVTGGAVRVKFGSNPTAVAAEGGGWLLLAETNKQFAATAGDKVAVIDA
jgi:hypothetical protein